MKNRIFQHFDNDDKERESVNDIRTFFLACEFKPGAEFWGVLEPFAYDVLPAFIYGSLGIIAYEPPSYAIVETGDDCQPLLGYVVTISNQDTVMLLDRLKGYLGANSFNTHVRKLIHAYTEIGKVTNAWYYAVSSNVLNAYQSIESVEFGITNDDPKQLELLEKIIEDE